MSGVATRGRPDPGDRAARSRRGHRARRDPSGRHRPVDRARADDHRGGPRRHDAGRHRPDPRLRHRPPAVRTTGRIVPSGAAPPRRRRRPPRRIPCLAAACRVGRRRARAGRRPSPQPPRPRPMPREPRESVHEIAIQLHGGIGNTWECLAHVYLRRSLLSTDVLRRRRSQPGTRARRTPACREVPDGLPGLTRGGRLPSALARVARGQQPAPPPVVDLRRVLGASARLAPVAPRRRVLRAARGPRSTAATTPRPSTT